MMSSSDAEVSESTLLSEGRCRLRADRLERVERPDTLLGEEAADARPGFLNLVRARRPPLLPATACSVGSLLSSVVA